MLLECSANSFDTSDPFLPRSASPDRTSCTPTQLMLYNVREMGLGPYIDPVGTFYTVQSALNHPSATYDDVAWGANLMSALYYNFRINAAGKAAKGLTQEFLSYAATNPESQTLNMPNLLHQLESEVIHEAPLPISNHTDRSGYTPTQLMLYNVHEVGLGPHVDHVGTYYDILNALEHESASISDVAWGARLMSQLYFGHGIEAAALESKKLAHEFLESSAQSPDLFMLKLGTLYILNDLGESITAYSTTLADADLNLDQLISLKMTLYGIDTPEAEELRQALDQRRHALKLASQTPKTKPHSIAPPSESPQLQSVDTIHESKRVKKLRKKKRAAHRQLSKCARKTTTTPKVNRTKQESW